MKDYRPSVRIENPEFSRLKVKSCRFLKISLKIFVWVDFYVYFYTRYLKSQKNTTENTKVKSYFNV